jgi:hypothetical protein
MSQQAKVSTSGEEYKKMMSEADFEIHLATIREICVLTWGVMLIVSSFELPNGLLRVAFVFLGAITAIVSRERGICASCEKLITSGHGDDGILTVIAS